VIHIQRTDQDITKDTIDGLYRDDRVVQFDVPASC